MNFFIVDDDEAIRSMISEIIEDYDLGNVVGQAEDGALIDIGMLNFKKVDILIIDLLMPIKDGIHTVKDFGKPLAFKIIMLSQVEDKKIIGEAYNLGIEYYITKPINRLEVIKVIEKVISNIKLEKSISDIQKTLSLLGLNKSRSSEEKPVFKNTILESAEFILTDLGMITESGSKDILDMLQYIIELDKNNSNEYEFPSLKNLFINISKKRLGKSHKEIDLKKEIKASEQRVRRAILQGLTHIASLGLTDYSNPKFEDYASKFFDFTEVRKKMMELENEILNSHIRINTKKFIKVLYMESKKNL
ncbi:transcriptional regulatory protein GlnL [Clostridium pasteurianum DSM 525 = ATCC 6013]|uniref:Stage 0 sporulation protein A homolog n=1 Tax=Clostridium pasteurianum DSM 525 = ATCC 6013 TaxID=1262449 RepID=A0A0H3J020_CLOPA|nr:response regulator [Clostridium pasteurianum]AJA47161.1 transcriptional regulatory protein GlnL [Clostridium pasteurianum DSM 525 = ATCC 6013]AJA51149.1 transcriptional regulatory protein GlnL [Clostridium pasteurianum DSM 525 = ATCC 6013]AOZ74519.1 transcriptional regulator [Clostridium pasteurianum DSM 525 = ATCC 6013]AOZ78316.1 transcriptional regulator [Clostridium pasteurianum]ELP59452.1 two-component response regulator [Clostridium pasteurianum DSM 525 = ATCC 6013]